ncbi:acyl carrier protein [Microbispora sp. NPDC046933]|uniref:acyl carrier protein n=1 Tax=Microbispora sp. NPDC046933 TaxID=3155618 RepID=UPI0033C9BA22
MSDTAYVELVRKMMSELLGTPDIEETDDLYSAGGDSFTAIRLAWRLSEATGVELNVAEDIMPEPTPCAIARILADRSPGAVAE